MTSSGNSLGNSLCNRRKKLSDWLEQVFESEEIPQLDENESTLKALYELMERSLEAEKDAYKIINLEKKYTELYNQKSEELASRLDLNNLPLSSATLESIDWLAKMARDMNLKEPTLTNFLLGFCEAAEKKNALKRQNKTTEYQLSILSKKVAKTIKENELMKRDIKKLQEPNEILQNVESKLQDQATFFTRKCKVYKSSIAKNEEYLKNVGFETSLSHHELMAEAKELEEIESQLSKYTSHLESYKSLPVNKESALLKVAELKLEIKELEGEFQRLLELTEENCP